MDHEFFELVLPQAQFLVCKLRYGLDWNSGAYLYRGILCLKATGDFQNSNGYQDWQSIKQTKVARIRNPVIKIQIMKLQFLRLAWLSTFLLMVVTSFAQPPEFTTFPNATSINDTGFDLEVGTDIESFVYYVVLALLYLLLHSLVFCVF